MTDFLDDLVPILHDTKAKWPGEHTLEEPTNFHKIAKRPDALVLAIVRTRCQTCGSVHEYPSQWLLCRYGKSYSWTRSCPEAEPDLPLEIRTMEIENAYCLACFAPGTHTHHSGGDRDNADGSQPQHQPEQPHEAT